MNMLKKHKSTNVILIWLSENQRNEWNIRSGDILKMYCPSFNGKVHFLPASIDCSSQPSLHARPVLLERVQCPTPSIFTESFISEPALVNLFSHHTAEKALPTVTIEHYAKPVIAAKAVTMSLVAGSSLKTSKYAEANGLSVGIFIEEVKMLLIGMLVVENMRIQVFGFFELDITEVVGPSVADEDDTLIWCVDSSTRITLLEHAHGSSLRISMIQNPGLWTDQVCQAVGGVRNSVQFIIQEAVQTLSKQHNEDIQGFSVSHGLILHGASGLGKTLLATTIVKLIDSEPLLLSCEALVRKERGGAERALSDFLDAVMLQLTPREDLEEPAHYHRGRIAVIDGLELICRRREQCKGVTEVGLSAVFLECLDKISSEALPVFFICITQDIRSIDPSVLQTGRLESLVELQPPTCEGRYEINRLLTSKLPFSEQVINGLSEREFICQQVALRTHGFTGADLQKLCSSVLARHLSEYPEQSLDNNTWKNFPTLQTFLEILEGMVPSSLTSQSLHVLQNADKTFADVGGLQDAKSTLHAAILVPLRRAFTTPFGNVQGTQSAGRIMLHGPPGTGKTLLAHALAGEAKGLANFLPVACGQLISKFVGETEKAISKIFEAARSASPCIIFLDQIEIIGSFRGYQTSTEQTFDRVLSTLLVELDGIKSEENAQISVIAATNELKLLDAALLRPGRFDNHICIGKPVQKERLEIFKKHLSTIPLSLNKECSGQCSKLPDMLSTSPFFSQSVDCESSICTTNLGESTGGCCLNSLLHILSSFSEGMSGADISQVCNEAVLDALRENIHCLEVNDLFMIKKLQAFANKFKLKSTQEML